MKSAAVIKLMLAAFVMISVARAGTLGLYPVDTPDGARLSAEAVQLGEYLFFDKRLSLDESLSCASCHEPGKAYADPRPHSPALGKPRHRRNATSLLNVGYRRSLGWDGNARTLEQQFEQSFGPYGDMGISLSDAIGRLESDPRVVESCRSAFASEVNASCLARAVAAFERNLVSGSSRFDRFLFGNESGVLTERERHGWELFSGKAACIDCHDVFHPSVNPLGGAYATFSDERFHNLGVGHSNGRMSDTGRYDVTRDPADFGSFKTPMLRNVRHTAPYMHDGSLSTLAEVIDFYDRGGNDNEYKTAGVKRLFLSTEEKAALVAFLESLDAGYYEATASN